MKITDERLLRELSKRSDDKLKRLHVVNLSVSQSIKAIRGNDHGKLFSNCLEGWWVVR